MVADLRGYGDSVSPADGGAEHGLLVPHHGSDQVEVMAALGHDRFFLAGHGGARAAHRLAPTIRGVVRKVALLDILPTRYVWGHPSREWALNSWHWSFMAQPDECSSA